MGSLIAKLFRPWFNISINNVRIIMLGLDAAGKTTILYKLRLGEIVTTIPTIGFNVETVTYKNINFTTWDLGGRGSIRALHRFYYQGMNAMIFVVDSNDRERIEEAREQLERALDDADANSQSPTRLPVLIFANKQDLPNAMSLPEIQDKLGISSSSSSSTLHSRWKERDYLIQHSCALNGDGLYEGLDWLSGAIKRQSVTSSNPASSTPTSSNKPATTATKKVDIKKKGGFQIKSNEGTTAELNPATQVAAA